MCLSLSVCVSIYSGARVCATAFVRCQYLNFCTSKASKVSTCSRVEAEASRHAFEARLTLEHLYARAEASVFVLLY